MKDWAVINWILRKIRYHIPLLAAVIGLNAGSAVLGVYFALGTRGVIDAATAGDLGVFWRACVVQLCVICGILVCTSLSGYLRDALAVRLDREWKKQLLDSLLHGEYARVASCHSAELINRLSNDVRILCEGVVGILPSLVSLVVRLVSAVLVLTVMAPGFTVFLVVGGVAAIAGTGVIRCGLKNLHKKVSHAEGRVLSFFQEALEGLLLVQAMDLTTEVERRSDRLLNERFAIQRTKIRASTAANTGVSVLYYLAGFASLVWCSFRLLHGKMSFGTLTAVTQLVGQIQAPFLNLSGIIPRYAAMTAAAERLMELQQFEVPIQISDDGMWTGEFDAVGAQNVTFAYDGEQVLSGATFSVPKGSFVVISGVSGIGKSTILKLLLGIFTPEQGMLYVERDGERRLLSPQTRKLFSYVPQGNILFSGTLRENLTISRPEASEEEIGRALYVSAFDQCIPQLADGLETVIGENAEGLSEGQAQRLAIARAVLSEAPILLLDEATSALDAETEKTVLERIAQMPGRTCIAVTHRPAAVQHADVQLEVTQKGVRVKQIKR